MLKTFLIGIKDLRLAFRDRAALILMLAAPFVRVRRTLKTPVARSEAPRLTPRNSRPVTPICRSVGRGRMK